MRDFGSFIRGIVGLTVIGLGLLVVFSPRIAWPFTANELMLLEVEADGYQFPTGLDAYHRNEQLYLPLIDIISLLDLAITVEEDRAEGWFIEPQREFILLKRDDGTWHLWLEGDELVPHPDHIIQYEGVPYVAARALSSWWPLEFELNYSELMLHIKTLEQFPFSKKLQRKSGRLHSRNGPIPIAYPPLDDPYLLVELPSMSINLSHAIRRINGEVDKEPTLRYSLKSRGDLFWMSSQLYLGGNREGGISSARISLERADHAASLLGPLQATRFEVGDISSNALPLLTGNSGRGIVIENSPVASGNYFDQMELNGDHHPGWEVEAYHNGLRIGYTTVDSDGRYNFEDVDLFYGTNKVTLYFYGPGGEKETENRVINLDAGRAQPGQFIYQLSLVQPGRAVIELNEIPDNGEKKGLFTFGYGLLRQLQLNGGLQLSTLEGNTRYSSLGLETNFMRSSLRIDATANRDEAKNYSYLLQIPSEYIDMRVGRTDYRGFAMEDGETPLLTEYSVALLMRLSTLSVGISMNRELYETQAHDRYRLRMSGRNFGIGWSTVFSSGRTFGEGAVSSGTVVAGRMGFSQRLFSSYHRLNIGYRYPSNDELKDEGFVKKYITTIDLASSIPIDNQEQLTLDLEYDPDTGGQRYGLGLSWTHPYLRITPQITYRSQSNDLLGYLSVSTNLQRRRSGYAFTSSNVTNQGNIQGFMYEDHNMDGRYNLGEPPLARAELAAIQHRHFVESDAGGIAQLQRPPNWQPTDLNVMAAGVEDPSLTPLFIPFSVTPRPGHWVYFEVPFVKSGEIDGVIYRADHYGVERPAPQIWVELVDEAGSRVDKQHSSSDGFYLFDQVFPGRYRLKVANSHYSDWITINHQGDIVSDIDIVLPSNVKVKPKHE